MITATVSFYGVVRHLVDRPHATIFLPGVFTLQDVVDALEALHGRKLREALLATGGCMNSHVKLYIDGNDIEGELTERFGPFEGEHRLDIFVVPMCEGGRE